MDALTRRQLEAFLEEDLGRGDVTSEAVIPAAAQAAGVVRSHAEGTVAGLAEARLLAELTGVTCEALVADGATVGPGDEVLRLAGHARAVLGVERTLLNLLGHMSGVATATRRMVETVAGTGTRVAATRKTLPGLRGLEKRAVVLGGGDPHRGDLSAAVLIKDNHLALIGDPGEAVRRARGAAGFTCTIEIEVETTDAAVAAARAGADILMLDNMQPAQVRATIAALVDAGLRDGVQIEASGGIRPETARAYAEAGADVISCGALTASATAFDFSLTLEPGPPVRPEPQLATNQTTDLGP